MFVIRGRGQNYLEIDHNGFFRWNNDLQRSTRFGSFALLVRAIVKAVKNRPDNWRIDNQNWDLELVEVDIGEILPIYPPIKVVRVIE